MGSHGSVVGVWVSDAGPDEAGRLSLYTVDPDTGLADLSDPILADAPAFAGFSLRTGRLAWSSPEDGGDTSVEVLAWQGKTVGRLQLSHPERSHGRSLSQASPADVPIRGRHAVEPWAAACRNPRIGNMG